MNKDSVLKERTLHTGEIQTEISQDELNTLARKTQNIKFRCNRSLFPVLLRKSKE